MIRDEEWRLSAPCASVGDGNLWFPEGKERALGAKRICRSCDYRTPCLEGALERHEGHGIWGAVNARQFGRIRRELREAA